MSTRIAGLAVASLVVTACAALGGITGGAQTCETRFSADRCGALADRAAIDLGLDPAEISVLDVLPDPDAGTIRLGGAPVLLRVHLADGTTRDTVVQCVGVSSGDVPACMDDPAIRVSSATLGGYRDVPCFDESGLDCATPNPPIQPAAAATARSILVERVVIPVDELGRHEVRVGEGSLPNGILTEASLRLVDDWPDGLSLVDAVVSLEVRSLEPDGKPFDNYFTHGWREGLERVEAVVVFDVAGFEPGAVLSIEDVVVR